MPKICLYWSPKVGGLPGCSEKSSTMPSHLSSNAVNSCVAAAVLPLLCRLARTSWMLLLSESSR